MKDASWIPEAKRVKVTTMGRRSGKKHTVPLWFVSKGPGSRWARVAVATVPNEVRRVPITYYKVKPKHAKGKKGDCPPGHAKYGRC